MTNHNLDPEDPQWETVAQLFGAYLHQDYDAEYEDGWAAVRDFAFQPRPAQSRAAGGEIRRLLSMFDDDEDLADAVDRLGMAYDPPSDGYTYRQWLEQVANFLESR